MGVWLAAAISISTSGMAPAPLGATPPTAAVGEADLARCFEAQAKLVPFSGVLLVDRGGQRFLRVAGMMDADERVPIDHETQFRLASAQKVLTKVAIGQLVDRGVLDFDAPIGTYLKGIPVEMAAITIDQLVHHRSGVPSFTRMTPETMDAMTRARNARELLPLVVAQPLEFAAGARDAYSNGGYWLLGAVVETVTGKEYGEYLGASIFRPLGMTATSLESGPDTAVRKTRMVPGQPPLATPRAVKMPSEPRGTPAGDGVSTAHDMMRLGKALLDDSLLSAGTKARLFPRGPGGPWRIGQSGGNIGANTDFAVFPDSGLVSVTLSNFDPPAGDLMGLVMRQAALGAGCKPLREEDRPGPRRLLPPPGPGPAAQRIS